MIERERERERVRVSLCMSERERKREVSLARPKHLSIFCKKKLFFAGNETTVFPSHPSHFIPRETLTLSLSSVAGASTVVS